jgi:hypothetical protein
MHNNAKQWDVGMLFLLTLLKGYGDDDSMMKHNA